MEAVIATFTSWIRGSTIVETLTEISISGIDNSTEFANSDLTQICCSYKNDFTYVNVMLYKLMN